MSSLGRPPAMSEDIAAPDATEAMKLMEAALGVLDRIPGADHISAHLDLAIHRLKSWMTERG